jgi:hypothetical protein
LALIELQCEPPDFLDGPLDEFFLVLGFVFFGVLALARWRTGVAPRALAAIRPALVRSTIRDRSKSAMPANTVSTMRLASDHDL